MALELHAAARLATQLPGKWRADSQAGRHARLRQALDGWDAMASELREAAGAPPLPSDDPSGDCSATQARPAACQLVAAGATGQTLSLLW